MDSQGNSMLGLYQHIFSEKLVLIGKPFGVPVVFEPAVEDINNLMKDEVPLRAVLLKSCWKTSQDKNPPLYLRLLIRTWIGSMIPAGTMRSFKGRHYPNYYYVLVNAMCSSE